MRNSRPWAILILLAAAVIIFFWRSRVARYEAFQDQSATESSSVDLVIARYKEDLAWLKDYSSHTFRTIYIYNKGPSPFEAPVPNAKIIPLANVGVCDHTYLHHIIQNYNTLADITIFLPGSADNSSKSWKLQKIIERAFKEKIPTMTGTLGTTVIGSEQSFTIDSWRVTYPKNQDANESYTLTPANPRPFKAWMEKYLPGKDSKITTFHGMFSVHRTDIQRNSKDLYQQLHDQLDGHKFPEAAHYMERAWGAIFSPLPDTYFLAA